MTNFKATQREKSDIVENLFKSLEDESLSERKLLSAMDARNAVSFLNDESRARLYDIMKEVFRN